MIESSRRASTRKPLQVVLVDPDPIFRVGLRAWLEHCDDLRVVAESGDGNAALAVVSKGMSLEEATPNGQLPLDLVILEPQLRLNQNPASAYLFQQLKLQFPTLPLLLLSGRAEDELLALAYQLGVEGYCPKGADTEGLIVTIRHLSQGGRSWPTDTPGRLLAQTSSSQPQAKTAFITRWRYRLLASGLREMDASLAQLQSQLNTPELSWLEQLVLSGQRREIRCARWLVSQMLPSLPMPQPATETQSVLPNSPATQITRSLKVRDDLLAGSQTWKSLLFESTLAKCQTNLQNLTGEPQEIDILNLDKKRELLAIVLRQVDLILGALQSSQIKPEQLEQQKSQILIDLWQNSLGEFFGKYSTLSLPPLSRSLIPAELIPNPLAATASNQEVMLVPRLLLDQGIVVTAILEKIPLLDVLLAHFLFQIPIPVDNTAYAVGSPDAMRQTELLLHNLVLRVSNAVIQPLLNQFASLEDIKQNFYDRQVISTREIERFRNALSWKYRYHNLVAEPKEIFESRTSLLTLNDRGLEKISIYLSRRQELVQLQGLQATVTLALEIRDAIAPPLRATVGFLGRGLVYLLTQVIGRGLGLIARGILQGLGNSWQDWQTERRSQVDSRR